MVKSVLEYLENSAARFPDKKAVADDKSSMTRAVIHLLFLWEL